MNRIITKDGIQYKRQVIFDKDVIVTDQANALCSLNSVLSSQSSRISRLESNAKWLYKYGGMGSGGGGGGTEETSFKAQICDERGIYLQKDTVVSLNYGAVGTYTFTVRVLNAGESNYSLTYQYEQYDELLNKTVLKKQTVQLARDTGGKIQREISVYLNVNTSLTFMVENTDSEEEQIAMFYSSVMVVAYDFKLKYVYADTKEEIADLNGRSVGDGDLRMVDYTDRGVAVKFISNVEIALGTTTQYSYKNWDSPQLCTIRNSDETVPAEKKIEGNTAKDIILPFVTAGESVEAISGYLANENNAGGKTFELSIQLDIGGTTTSLGPYVLADTLIPQKLFLKTVNDAITDIEQPVTTSCYQYVTSQGWISVSDDPSCISAVGKDSATYSAEAAEGTVIRENDSYYKVSNGAWSQLQEEPPSAVNAISHGNNFYTVQATDGLKIKINHATYGNAVTAGSIMSFRLTPYDGRPATPARKYKLAVYLDGWKLNDILNIPTELTERSTSTASINIPVDNRDFHRITFQLTSNDDAAKSSSQTYFFGAKTLESFDWYGRMDEVRPQYGNYYRKNIGASGIKDKTTGKNITATDTIIKTIKSGDTGYAFTNLPESATSEDYKYDQTFNIGLQYSEINDSNEPIFTLNTESGETRIRVYPTKFELIGKDGKTVDENKYSRKIDIFKEKSLDMSDTDKFHLITIHTKLEPQAENVKLDSYYRSVSLYIDGVYDGTFMSFVAGLNIFNGVTLHAGNYVANLMENALFKITGRTSKFSCKDVVRYYYAYDEKILQHGYDPVEQKSEYERKLALYDAFANFDIADDGFIMTTLDNIKTIARNSNANVMMVEYDDKVNDAQKKYNRGIGEQFKVEVDVDNFKNWMKYSYGTAGGYGSEIAENANVPVKVSWSESQSEMNKVYSPVQTANEQDFIINLQGSSSLGYHAKNFELKISQSDEENEELVYSPNFDVIHENGGDTFLPEQSFTLKADVVDSSHSNNDVMGNFIIDNMSMFQDIAQAQKQAGVTETSTLLNNIKVCLHGFPILLFLHTSYYITSGSGRTDYDRYYFLGIYNFNTGRKSYYNLGYKSIKNLENKINSLPVEKKPDGKFCAYVIDKTPTPLSGLRVAEIQDNSEYFDFSQYNPTILFSQNKDDGLNMFGDLIDGSEGTGGVGTIQADISTFMNQVANAGWYVFNQMGKTFPTSADQSSEGNSLCCGYSAPYATTSADMTTGIKQTVPTNIVPNTAYQVVRSIKTEEEQYVFLPPRTVQLDFNSSLRTLIEGDQQESITYNKGLDYDSAAQYYTICMAFGLIDSVQKNLNIKCWNSPKPGGSVKMSTFYIAFYDMDTCLGINNDGDRIDYRAFSDYWASNYDSVSRILGNTKVAYDFSPKNLPGISADLFDIPSSYLFAIAKYAPTIYITEYEGATEMNLRSPNSIWAKWRRTGGCLQSAEGFIQNYYKSYLDRIPLPAFNMNYKQKYLKTIVSSEKEVDSYMSDQKKFWGRKLAYVRDWLNKRLHAVDAFFNMQTLNDVIGKNHIIPKPQSTLIDKTNSDIEIINDIFSDSTDRTAYVVKDGTYIGFTAMPFSPIAIAIDGTTTGRYVTPVDMVPINAAFKISGMQRAVIGGSAQMSKIDNIDTFIDKNGKLYLKSRIITELNGSANTTYDPGKSCSNWEIECPALNSIRLISQNYGGQLYLDGKEYSNLLSVDVSNGGISFGIDQYNNTSLEHFRALNKKSGDVKLNLAYGLKDVGMTGTFGNIEINCWKKNCAFPTQAGASFNSNAITITNPSGNDPGEQHFDGATFSLQNDLTITKLTLDGDFASVYVNNCRALKEITFVNCGDSPSLSSFTLIYPDSAVATNRLKIGVSGKTAEGTADFSDFKNLNALKIQYAKGLSAVKIDSAVQLGQNALYGCGALSGISLGSTNANILVTGDGTFGRCPNFTLSGLYTLKQGSAFEVDRSYLSVSPGLSSLNSVFAHGTGLTNNDARFFLGTACKPAFNSVTSMEDLFRGQQGITYGFSDFQADYCAGKCRFALDFPNCSNAKTAFYGTKLAALNKHMFENFGTNRATVQLDAFMDSACSCTTDSLYYVIDKLQNYNMNYYQYDSISYTSYKYTVYQPNYRTDTKTGKKTGITSLSEMDIVPLSSMFTIRDLSASANAESESEITYKHPTQLQKIFAFEVKNKMNMAGTFTDDWTYAQQNGITISRFLCQAPKIVDSGASTSLSGFFRNVKIKAIGESLLDPTFYDADGENQVTRKIDLSTFIDWNRIGAVTNLFRSDAQGIESLRFDKYVSYPDFQGIWDAIALSANQLTSMSYLFRDAEIRNYTGADFYLNSQRFRNTHPTKIGRITAIDRLFENMSVTYGGEAQPISLTHDFMKYLSGVRSAQLAFYGLHLKHTLPYDFFYKRYYETAEVCLSTENPEEFTKAYLHTPAYTREITNLVSCFAGITFSENAGFDPRAGYNTSLSGISGIYVTDTYGNVVETDTYFRKSDLETPVRIEQSAVTEIADTLGLSTFYTRYVATNLSVAGGGGNMTIQNFNLDKDYESKIKDRLFVAPDILYGCTNAINTGKIDWVFANTKDPDYATLNYAAADIDAVRENRNDMTFSGALPKNLLKNFSGLTLKSAFKNINVLPTKFLEYTETITDPESLSGDWLRTCYAFVPEKFVKSQTDLTEAFNFRIFVPDSINRVPPKKSNDFYVMTFDSIPENTTSLVNALPRKGSIDLYYYNNARIKINETVCNFNYYLTGKRKTTETGTTMAVGFDFSAFKYLSLNDLFYEYTLALASGYLVEPTTGAFINAYIQNSAGKLAANKYLLNMFAYGRISAGAECHFGTLTDGLLPIKFITPNVNARTSVYVGSALNYNSTLGTLYNNYIDWTTDATPL